MYEKYDKKTISVFSLKIGNRGKPQNKKKAREHISRWKKNNKKKVRELI